jgi:hypothetical protein
MILALKLRPLELHDDDRLIYKDMGVNHRPPKVFNFVFYLLLHNRTIEFSSVCLGDRHKAQGRSFDAHQFIQGARL